jgi:hypothetical protein
MKTKKHPEPVVDLRDCPLCGAGNADGENNVRFSAQVFGTIHSRPTHSDIDPPNHFFQACQMVRCNVCGITLIDTRDAKKEWNEGRGRYSRK